MFCPWQELVIYCLGVTMIQRRLILDSTMQIFVMNSDMKIIKLTFRLLAVGWISILLVACGGEEDGSRVETLPFYGDPSFTPQWLSPTDDALENFHRISSFELINQDGDTLTSQQLGGKIYVADFFFTSCPGICPKMTKNMALLQEAFLEDPSIVLLSHSVTPQRDSIPVLREYAAEKGVISNKWHLLTGDRQEIYSLGRNDYFIEEDLGVEKDVDDFLHTENFVLIDANKHIRGIYNGLNKTDIQQLIADIYTLKKES